MSMPLTNYGSELLHDHPGRFGRSLSRNGISRQRVDSFTNVSVPPRMVALLIGINNYTRTRYASLTGAEADAWRWRDFLVNDLGVPNSDSHITMLLGQFATRLNIINALRDLANNPHIRTGDPIFIFYAGHGSEVEYRAADGSTEMIQVVIPSDVYLGGHSQPPVYCITDLEIGRLIDHIADKKGDNITVIMDCCHSASGTRGDEEDDDRRVRTVELPTGSLDPEFNRQIYYGARGTDYARAGLRSHILLAACASTEKAQEYRGHGEFSTALLNLFRDQSQSQSLNYLRYCDILPRMKRIPGQNPQCEGVNRHRFIFNAQVASRPLPKCYKIQFRVLDEDSHSRAEPMLILDAGSAQGVNVDAKFNIYAANDTSFRNVLGTAVVKRVGAFYSIMTPLKMLLPVESVAHQVRPAKSEDLRLFVPRDDEFRNVFKQAARAYNLDNIALVGDLARDVHLRASMENFDEVTFNMADRRVTERGFHKHFPPINSRNLREIALVLNRIAHYYRELDREGGEGGEGDEGSKAPYNLIDSVEIEFYRLGPDKEPDWRKLKPAGPNLLRDGVVDFEVIKGAPYGMRIVNRGNCDLFPYFFYFNNNDLSIASLYETPSPTGYAVEAPLKMQGYNSTGILTLGYGSSGVPPCTYKLELDSVLNVDFLKIFVTTKPIDMSGISFSSPFKPTRGLDTWTFKMPDIWNTISIPIIQRRPRPNRNMLLSID